MPGRKLKVFQAQFGFYDTVVAAPSQVAALRAWDTRQDLFASGDAKPTADEAAVAAAIAHPGIPLRRAVGSHDPFVLNPTNLPKLPGASRRTAPKRRTAGKAADREEPVADRSRLDRAEGALRALDRRRKDEEAAFRREEEEIEQRKSEARNAYVIARKAATAKVVEARKAYRAPGRKG
jgi:hypothetical protein